jgi:hypothetical protein
MQNAQPFSSRYAAKKSYSSAASKLLPAESISSRLGGRKQLHILNVEQTFSTLANEKAPFASLFSFLIQFLWPRKNGIVKPYKR